MKNLINVLLSVLLMTDLISINSVYADIDATAAKTLEPYAKPDQNLETLTTTLTISDLLGDKGKELQTLAQALMAEVNKNIVTVGTLAGLKDVRTDLTDIKAQIQLLLTFYKLVNAPGNTIDDGCMKRELPIYTDNVNKFTAALLSDTIQGVLYGISNSDKIMEIIDDLLSVANSTLPDLYGFYKYLSVDILNVIGGPDMKDLPAALQTTADNIWADLESGDAAKIANALALLAAIIGIPFALKSVS